MAAITAGPPVALDGPLPVVRPYRLVDVATIIDDSDPHWRAGAQIWPYPAGLPATWVMCPPGSPNPKNEGQAADIPVFGAFQVYLSFTCSAFSVGNDYDLFVRRATLAFNAKESYAVELEFSQGVADDLTPYLADGDLDKLNGGAATASVEALAELEDAIGETGMGGVIHATPSTIAFWSKDFVVYRDGPLLKTTNGTPVVSGTGYIGAQPVGSGAPTSKQAWAFATGPVQVRRGDVNILPGNIGETLDRETNVVTGRIERDYLVDWDLQLQAGVLVDRSL